MIQRTISRIYWYNKSINVIQIKISFKKQSAKLDGDRPGTNGYGTSIGSEPSYDEPSGCACKWARRTTQSHQALTDTPVADSKPIYKVVQI